MPLHVDSGGKTPQLLERLSETLDELVEIFLAGAALLDLLDCVNHGRVVLAAEAPAEAPTVNRPTPIEKGKPRGRASRPSAP